MKNDDSEGADYTVMHLRLLKQNVAKANHLFTMMLLCY